MGAVSYLIRAIPMTLLRKPIKNRFVKSFLYYVPYVTLAGMTFPSYSYSGVIPLPDRGYLLQYAIIDIAVAAQPVTHLVPS